MERFFSLWLYPFNLPNHIGWLSLTQAAEIVATTTVRHIFLNAWSSSCLTLVPEIFHSAPILRYVCFSFFNQRLSIISFFRLSKILSLRLSRMWSSLDLMSSGENSRVIYPSTFSRCSGVLHHSCIFSKTLSLNSLLSSASLPHLIFLFSDCSFSQRSWALSYGFILYYLCISLGFKIYQVISTTPNIFFVASIPSFEP